jgi:hypothetical protein
MIKLTYTITVEAAFDESKAGYTDPSDINKIIMEEQGWIDSGDIDIIDIVSLEKCKVVVSGEFL